MTKVSMIARVSRGIAAVALATLGLVAVAPTATAHASNPSLVLIGNGQWKAYASLDTSTGRLCVRAYHSVPGAFAEVLLSQPYASSWGHARDRGGDDERTCSYVTGYRHGDFVTMHVFHVSSSGQQLHDYVHFYY